MEPNHRTITVEPSGGPQQGPIGPSLSPASHDRRARPRTEPWEAHPAGPTTAATPSGPTRWHGGPHSVRYDHPRVAARQVERGVCWSCAMAYVVVGGPMTCPHLAGAGGAHALPHARRLPTPYHNAPPSPNSPTTPSPPSLFLSLSPSSREYRKERYRVRARIDGLPPTDAQEDPGKLIREGRARRRRAARERRGARRAAAARSGELGGAAGGRTKGRRVCTFDEATRIIIPCANNAAMAMEKRLAPTPDRRRMASIPYFGKKVKRTSCIRAHRVHGARKMQHPKCVKATS